MALVVNTNVSSLTAQRNLLQSKNDLDTAMERLSSGKRINSAADDAAGLAISNRMESQIRGLNMAVRNANDGISLAQTAEGAMDEISNMLQRMRELAVQSANSVNNVQDRTSINDEVSQLQAEIDRVVSQTRFNDMKLMDGSFNGASIQVGLKSNESIDFSIGNLSANNIGRENLAAGTQTITSASAEGTAAVVTRAQLAFHGNDSYTFKVDGTTVTGTQTGDSPANIVDAINNAMAAASKTNIVAELKNGVVELTNTSGGNIGVTEFSSANAGTATFNVLTGTGSTTFLDDTAAVTSSGTATGSASSSTGVLLKLENTDSTDSDDTDDDGGTYTFKANGVDVSVGAGDSDAEIKAKIKAALGTGYDVFVAADTITSAYAGALGWTDGTEYTDGTTTFGASSSAGGAANGVDLAEGEFLIWHSDANQAINITNFEATDGVAAGTVGTIRIVGDNSETVLVDSTNKFEVANDSANTMEANLHFSSSTSNYNIEIDGLAITVEGSKIADGTAGAAIITAINAAAADAMNAAADKTGSSANGKVAAGGVGSLGNTPSPASTSAATAINYEVVQNGSTITIKKKADEGSILVEIGATGIVADPASATAASDAKFFVNKADGTRDPGTAIDLNDVNAGVHTTQASTASKMTVEFSGDATYTFKLTNLAGTAQHTTAVSAAMVNGNTASLVAAINNQTASTGITASADPNNSKAVILTRTDGKAIQLTNFTSTGDATALATPSAGQGIAKLLDDNSASTTASAGAAGAAVATKMTLTLQSSTDSGEKVSFKISDGSTVAAVRATSPISGSAVGDDLETEINAALAAAGLSSAITVEKDVVVTDGVSQAKFTLTRADGGVIDITQFTSDKTATVQVAPLTGQGQAVVLDDDANGALGKSVGEISVTTTGGAQEALAILDNAIQQVDNERGTLGAIQNRLTHTISNLTNISTNTSAAQSRIQDADFAVEAANLAKAQVLQQAGTSMLAQANASPQYVLSLLQ